MKRSAIIPVGVVAVLCSGGVPWLIHLRHEALDEECINNLRCIDGTKLQWALEHFALDRTNRPWAMDYMGYFNAVATEEDVHLYNSRNHYPMPRCPRGGKYTIGRIIDPPTCSYPGHALPEDRDLIPGFLNAVLVDTYDAGASEVVIGATPEHGEGTPLKCKIGAAWHETLIPSYLRQRVISDLQRRTGLSASQFPNEGDIVVTCSRVQLRWHLRMDGPLAECRMTAPAGPEPNEERTNEFSDDWWWNQFTNAVHWQVACEARGMQPPFRSQENWQEFWERRMETARRWELDPERHIAYIKSQRLEAGLRDYDWSH